MSEHDLQLTCIAWFKNQKIGEIIPVVNEATYKNKNFAINKGASDLIVVLPNKVIFCELKVGNNKQSNAQIEFDNRITELGYNYYLVRSLDEFKNVCL